MNIREFHAGIVSLCREVSGDGVAKLDEARLQQIRGEVARLLEQTDLLLDLARAYQYSGVRRAFEDAAGNEYLLGNFPEDANGRIYGKHLSTHGLALGQILDCLDGEAWRFEDELLYDLWTEVAFVDGQIAAEGLAPQESILTDDSKNDVAAKNLRRPDGPSGNRKWRHGGMDLGIEGERPIIEITAMSATVTWKSVCYPVSMETAEAFQKMLESNDLQPVGVGNGKPLRKPAEWLKRMKQEFPVLAALVVREGNKGYRLKFE